MAQPAPGVAARPVVDARDYHGAGGPEEAPFRHDAELQQRAPRGSAKKPVAMGSGMSEWSSIESAEIWQPGIPG